MIINLDTIEVIFTLTALDIISLPPYKGSAIRGGFGHAFRKVVCAVRKKTCDDCLLKHRCAYSYIFETPPPIDTEMMRKYPRAPHPFVIEPPDGEKHAYQPGETLEFSLVLIGRGCDYLAYFVYAFEELGNIGLGRGKGMLYLVSITTASLWLGVLLFYLAFQKARKNILNAISPENISTKRCRTAKKNAAIIQKVSKFIIIIIFVIMSLNFVISLIFTRIVKPVSILSLSAGLAAYLISKMAVSYYAVLINKCKALRIIED